MVIKDKITKDWRKWLKETIQDLEIEIEIKKNTQSEGMLEMKNLDKWIGTTDTSTTIRIQEMEERESCLEDMIKETDS